MTPLEEKAIHEKMQGLSLEQQQIAIQDFDTAVIYNENETRVREAIEFKQKAIELGLIAQGMRI